MDTINNNSGIKPHESYPLICMVGGEAEALKIMDTMPDATATHFYKPFGFEELYFFREKNSLEMFKSAFNDWSEISKDFFNRLESIEQLRVELNSLPFHIGQRVVLINCAAAKVTNHIWDITGHNPTDHNGLPITLNGDVRAGYDNIRLATTEELDAGHRIDPVPSLQVGDDVVAIERLYHRSWMGTIKTIQDGEAFFNNPDHGLPLSWLRKATPEESLAKARLKVPKNIHPFNHAVKQIALSVGFKEQDQEDGSRDLPPHMYQFAFALSEYVKTECHAKLLSSEIDGYSDIANDMAGRWQAEVDKRRKVEDQLFQAQQELQVLREGIK